MKVIILLILTAVLALAAAQFGRPARPRLPGRPRVPALFGGFRPNTASQTSVANSGPGGSSIAMGTAVVHGREKRSPEPQQSTPNFPNRFAPSTAHQSSSANSGPTGTSTASGTATANGGRGRSYRGKRNSLLYRRRSGCYPIPGYRNDCDSAVQTSHADAGPGGTSIATGSHTVDTDHLPGSTFESR